MSKGYQLLFTISTIFDLNSLTQYHDLLVLTTSNNGYYLLYCYNQRKKHDHKQVY